MVPGLDLLCFWNLDAIVFTQRDDHMIPQLLTLSNRVFFSSEFFFFWKIEVMRFTPSISFDGVASHHQTWFL